ncbi:hypothetical protein HYV50_00365 [Candidatus Pacearchaeota archaeon]|nr:hypothetical protein [Candidatus Pacearchaeota archaeon]
MMKNPSFNVVIEETYHDEWRRLNYKLANLEIPQNAVQIADGAYNYGFYGKTKDFKKVDKVKEESLEFKVHGFIGFCDGIVLPFRGGIPNILERPRTLVFRDGRIFIEKGMMNDSKYMDMLESILDKAKKCCESQEINESYQKVMKLYSSGKVTTEKIIPLANSSAG